MQITNQDGDWELKLFLATKVNPATSVIGEKTGLLLILFFICFL